MPNINLPNYDVCRTWIRSARERGNNWDSIYFALKSDSEELCEFIENQKIDNFWPEDLDALNWSKLVDSTKEAEARALEISRREQQAVLTDESQDSGVKVPYDSKSSWQIYRTNLISSGFKIESVDEIENATIALLKRLNRDTTQTGPIKGLVIGHVQSGKTANMAALMAMAADWGWNFFIVLSGTIDSLRKQTQSRLLKDLNLPGNLHWTGLEHLSIDCSLDQRPQELRLEEQSNVRYFTVCLKNPVRLENLLKWMIWDKNKLKQMKIILIDDEADQASINTGNVDSKIRTRINNLIVNIVEGNSDKGAPCEGKPTSMNYISYTATPYANFLNESSPLSLYPKSFIRALKPSDEYFGPKQIFGIEESDDCDGLNIIRIVSASDLTDIKSLHDSKTATLPASMIESICWFLCAASCMRHWGYTKPISMLVHTSQRQSHHAAIAGAIQTWLENIEKKSLMELCRSLWEVEKNDFTIQDFRNSYKSYGRTDEEIRNYPKFSELIDGILLLVEKVTNIPLDEDKALQYSSHIHLCIDNCSKNSANEEMVRLVYPASDLDPYPVPAPAFIVVGGSTLSRGLTIEGLVSSYFLRGACQADTLMQMGRWFGYRRGYELLPRIWMSEDTIDKFTFLSQLEEELREDLRKFMIAGASPLDYGPRVKNSPKVSWLRITSKNKMQKAMEVDLDFTGISTQSILFDNDSEIMNNNIVITEEFLSKLGKPRRSDNENAYVWDNVNFEVLEKGLLNDACFKFHERARVFNDLKPFSEWVKKLTEEGKLKNWNVIVAGNGKIGDHDSTSAWNICNSTVGKVNRSRKVYKNSNSQDINIGVLRAPIDLLADVKKEKLSPQSQQKFASAISSEEVNNIRKEANIDDIPQLIIYRINKDSKAREKKNDSKNDQFYRKDLNALMDIIGICITLPGNSIRTNNAMTLTVKIDRDIDEDNSEAD